MSKPGTQMREPTYFLLASLLDGPLHGYAIIKRTADLSDGRVQLATGTLYTALDRLTAKGYVELVREEIVNGRARRSYGLTPPGAGALRSEGGANGGGISHGDRSEPPPEGGRRRAEGESRVTPFERHCRWLLRAYPAWYRRERSGEMLGTLLEASPPGRNWPSFRDARALIIGGLLVRGWAWWLSVLWVSLGAAGSGYVFLASTQPPAFRNLGQVATWVGEPGVITGAGELGGVAWLALTIPVLVAGFIRLRGWRLGKMLRAAAWAGAWAAGFVLMVPVADWQAPGPCGEFGCANYGYGGHAVVSWIELPICAAFLALGAVMTRILTVPAHGRNVPDTSSRSSRKASLRAPGACDLQP